MSTWELFAQPMGDGDWTGIGDRWYASQHGSSPPVPITVTEDAEGDYLGWLDAREGDPRNTGVPEMIQRKEIFSLQFTYGYEAEEQAGRGRAIRLRIEETA